MLFTLHTATIAIDALFGAGHNTRLTYALCSICANIPCYGKLYRTIHERDETTPSITEHTS